jgi:methylglutaconyl-CoA hydratase
MPTISITEDGPVARVTLARPEVRNAFNAELIRDLRDTFARLSDAQGIRAVVLSGEGKSFCGGADVQWMRGALDLSYDENVADAEAMSDMFRAIDRCSKPVVGRIFGAAIGGGAGLAAVCDVAIASEETIFGFTEVKLGILPAVISPFVLAKIGISHARALFFTGERFDAARALRIGLVHEIVPAEALEGAVARITGEILTAGPHAIAAAKRLISDVAASSYDQTREVTANAIARQRVSHEGQEGLRAFLERRTAEFAR